MSYKAIFFDRDGTLTYNDPAVTERMYAHIRQWGGTPYEIPYQRMMALFEKAAEGRTPWYRNVADEIRFTIRYNKLMLAEYGLRDNLEQYAQTIHELTWLKSKAVYPEVEEVLTYFQTRGYKMGVISDTSPSLRLTLEAAGIAQYFTSFTASSLVGASKPSPIIFKAALAAQGVTAAQSLYVDDYAVEADGARELGFTAFLIDRMQNVPAGDWVIRDLRELVAFVEGDA